MQRRSFIRSAALAAGFAWSGLAGAAPVMAPASGSVGARYAPDPHRGWRRFELVTRIAPQRADGLTRVWVPLPAFYEPGWQQPLGSVWSGNADVMRLVRDDSGAEMLYAEWAPGARAPEVEILSRFMTRDRAVDLATPGGSGPLTPAERERYTRATALLPTDGIVRDTAQDIVRGVRGDEAQARAIYEWIVDNTFREPTVRGCGTGDIRAMLVTGNLSGKCADLNALFVGLARSVGLPARDVYGLRVADSRFGYQSLGRSGDVSKAQHCRAEVHLARFGWVPVDPADVRKVVLEEPPGNLPLVHPRVAAVRSALFGAWEMNWLAYNDAHDIVLPGSSGPMVPFLMYPHGEDAAGRFDSLDPALFGYSLTSREIV